jgi:hypothetical protein
VCIVKVKSDLGSPSNYVSNPNKGDTAKSERKYVNAGANGLFKRQLIGRMVIQPDETNMRGGTYTWLN